ncbi:MAG TPA: type IV secretory system conjugative DNA transfer family protein [Clostridia bacterium]|nr:type IV secretory system conjugative DNA transfer family protein [Clostridia bacterium]
MKRDNLKANLVVFAFGLIPVIWLGLLIAPAISGGLPEILSNLTAALNHPFHIKWCEDSLKTVLVFIAAYGFGIGIYYSTKRNTRPREEHGSAKWGNANSVCRKYREKQYENNKILTRNVRIGLDGRKHRRNLNTFVVGGSGSGKTRFYAKPNAMQANTSLVVLDPKGEITRDVGNLLLKTHDVKVLDLINMEKSHCYNPFVYLKTDNDIQRLVTNLFKATTPKGSQSQDPFWDNAASMLLLALIFYLHYEAPKMEQNFPMVMEMLRAAEVREDGEDFLSPLDILFDRLEMRNPEHIALKYYRDYRSGSAKTLKSIQITLASRLEKFNLSSLISLTATDELDLGSMGEKKSVLFIILPDNDSSFNFLVSILYTQLFQALFYTADYKYGGSLPIPVHFLMDEFSNVSLPDDFSKILAVMRSRSVFVSIILQNIAALKALFEKEWESIIGNCDEFVYLGGNEQSTHKYVSELLGKETLDTNTYGKSSGRNGNYSTNYQITGRELMTPDEVRMLDNRYALLFIRGERPVLDEKYDILRHPNVGETADGSQSVYLHGQVTRAVASVSIEQDFNLSQKQQSDEIPTEQPTFDLLSEEDLEDLFEIEEDISYEKNQ